MDGSLELYAKDVVGQKCRTLWYFNPDEILGEESRQYDCIVADANC